MSLRVLILSASVGSGHNRAAEAIEIAARERLPSARVERIDVLDFANPLFRRCYGRGYFDLIAKAPHLIGYLYDRLDQPLKSWERPFNGARFGLQNLSLRRFIRTLTSDAWDLVICTHFLPAEIVASMRRAGRMHCPLAVVTTDFDTHRLWHCRPCELFFTATAEGKANLTRCGVPPDQIHVSGIPVHSAFRQRYGKLAARHELGFDPRRPLVLQLSGGVGIGPIEEIHRQLLSIRNPIQIVVVTGRNQRACEALKTFPCPDHHTRQIVGYTRQIDSYMAAADLVVTKPGGLTVSESLCRGLPMVVIDPIPGQETRNSDFILENGAGVKVNGLATMRVKLESLLTDPARLERMSDCATRLAKPHAASTVFDTCLSLVRPARSRTDSTLEPLATSSRPEEPAYL